MNAIMSEWETFCDISYYHLWRVRRKNERGFNDGYHLQNGEEAQALVELLNGLERERGEALMDRDDGDMAIMTRNHYERILKERNEAIRQFDEARAELSLKCQSVTIASGTISDLLKKSERLEKQIEGLNNFANERFDEIQRVRRERDEAMEALMKIEDVFVDGEDTYEGWKAMGSIAKAALEGKV